ncbi:Hsp20/alpha crystallin family protein [Bacillus sp. FJAT-49736]|uniref:Hsp20/alpha crystallin family protein n=1 Tax=Bacillus sp. FJAT-49736 TaxID=2833582 RepID=UPI001BC96BED|nr:Hsp20/alpha crystallin family protein [Bacillus sp. FJAT-49736]MBS4173131.1 Hsp20/alpha crystallin family protein [Bacillus sp. FJAT-49736]
MFPWNMFPFNNDMSKMLQQFNPKDMEKSVQDMISQFMPKQWQGSFDHNDMLSRAASLFPQNNQQSNNPPPTSIHPNVFETFDDVYVRIPISEDMIQKIKIYHTSNQLIIENTSDGNRETFTLPALVRKKGTTAQYKDGILEIKMPRSADLQYTEIDVSERL